MQRSIQLSYRYQLSSSDRLIHLGCWLELLDLYGLSSIYNLHCLHIGSAQKCWMFELGLINTFFTGSEWGFSFLRSVRQEVRNNPSVQASKDAYSRKNQYSTDKCLPNQEDNVVLYSLSRFFFGGASRSIQLIGVFVDRNSEWMILYNFSHNQLRKMQLQSLW